MTSSTTSATPLIQLLRDNDNSQRYDVIINVPPMSTANNLMRSFHFKPSPKFLDYYDTLGKRVHERYPDKEPLFVTCFLSMLHRWNSKGELDPHSGHLRVWELLCDMDPSAMDDRGAVGDRWEIHRIRSTESLPPNFAVVDFASCGISFPFDSFAWLM